MNRKLPRSVKKVKNMSHCFKKMENLISHALKFEEITNTYLKIF